MFIKSKLNEMPEDVFKDQDEQEIYNIAMLAMARHPSKEVICSSSAYWLSFARLYEVLVRHREIKMLYELPHDQKLRYWLTVVRCRPEKPVWVKKMICQGMYVYDLIKNKTGSNEESIKQQSE